MNNKKVLYEQIMNAVYKEVNKILNEEFDEYKPKKHITFDRLKKNIIKNLNSSAWLASIKPGEFIYDKMLQLLGKQERTKRMSVYYQDELVNMCKEIIDRFDVRSIDELIDFCKEYHIDGIPSWLKKGKYTVDLSEDGWTVFQK